MGSSPVGARLHLTNREDGTPWKRRGQPRSRRAVLHIDARAVLRTEVRAARGRYPSAPILSVMPHSLIASIRRRGGAARVATLTAMGASRAQLRTAVQCGELVRVRNGWLALPDAPADVVRAVAFGGRLACLSSARYHGLWTPDDDRVHVAVPRHAGRVHGHPDDLIIHWQSPAWSAHPSVVEPVPELVRQVLLCCLREDALTVIDSALNAGVLSAAELAAVVEGLPPRFAPVIGEVDSRSESGLETFCRVRLTRSVSASDHRCGYRASGESISCSAIGS